MKRLSIIILFALPFIFTSCEGDFADMFGDILDQAVGEAEVTITKENSTDTLEFEFSGISNIDTTIENVDISYLIGLSAHTSLEEQEIGFPYMLCTLGDTLEGLHNVNFVGGCPGNLQAISKLVEGMDAKEAASKLQGIRCGARATSCGDQFAQAILANL